MPELDRRDFLKLVGVGAGAAAAAGCSEKVEKLIPYVVQPEEITPGVPVYYASTCRECPAGCGLHVKTREGRPIKLEGNPEHPVNQGKLCARGQAGIGRTYHPDRFQRPMRRGADGNARSRSRWDDALARARRGDRPRAGQDLACSAARSVRRSSGLLDRVRDGASAPAARTVYEPFAPEALRDATAQRCSASRASRCSTCPSADLVVDFGSDFLESGLSPTEHAAPVRRRRATSRRIRTAARASSRSARGSR